MIYEPIENYTSKYTADDFDWGSILKLKLNMDNGPWLAGGAVRKLVMNESVKEGDLDFHFRTGTQMLKTMGRIQPSFDGTKLVQTQGWISTKNTYSFGKSPQYQCIYRRFYTNLLDMLEDFDFTVCQFVTDGKMVAYPKVAMQDVEKKILAPIESSKRSLTFFRVLKYMAYGFVPEASKIVECVNYVLDCEFYGEWDDPFVGSPDHIKSFLNDEVLVRLEKYA